MSVRDCSTEQRPLDYVAFAERVHRIASDAFRIAGVTGNRRLDGQLTVKSAGCCLRRIIPFRPLTSDSALKKAAPDTGRQKMWPSAGIRPKNWGCSWALTPIYRGIASSALQDNAVAGSVQGE
ncbi:hypothetical protein [Microbulbifer epialgicus]|uniref:Uncharacterized protein n=1 Tax=Microbulbifer epialgicus TaxID=393907 RepID=A0ABV4P4X0_9GAMM